MFAEGDRNGNFHTESGYEVEIHIPPGIIEMSIPVWQLLRAHDDICNFHKECAQERPKRKQSKSNYTDFSHNHGDESQYLYSHSTEIYLSKM